MHLVVQQSTGFPDFTGIFSAGTSATLAPLISTIYVHFRCSFIYADSSVVLDTVMDLLLNLNTQQSMTVQNAYEHPPALL
jgi:hypothetical protein